MKYVILSPPRTGSFLACQLLEEYLINKYPLEYARTPFYELFNRPGRTEASVILSNDKLKAAHKGIGVSTNKSILELMDKSPYNYLVKLGYKNVSQLKWLIEKGYKVITTFRGDFNDQLNSYAECLLTNKWHSYIKNPDKINFGSSYAYEQRVRSINTIDIEPYRKALTKYNTINFEISKSVNAQFIKLEDFQDDYDQFYLALGLTDFKQYVPNYDFIVSTKTKE